MYTYKRVYLCIHIYNIRGCVCACFLREEKLQFGVFVPRPFAAVILGRPPRDDESCVDDALETHTEITHIHTHTYARELFIIILLSCLFIYYTYIYIYICILISDTRAHESGRRRWH